MKKFFAPIVSLAIFGLVLSGCVKTVTKEVPVPVEVKVPVATPCPTATIRTVEAPEQSALDLIKPDTPMDKDIDYWKAWVLQLKAYIVGLETTVADQKSALEVCYAR